MEIKINLPKEGSTNVEDTLMDVYVLDYDDGYHQQLNEPVSDLEREVRNLKGRYRDIIKFNEALIIYDEWMDYLAEKYHGHDMLKKMIKNGIVSDYVPRKPRLKNNKALKYLYKHKIMVSSSSNNLIREDNLDDYLDEFYPDMETTHTEIIVMKDKLAKSLARDIDHSPYFKSFSYSSDAEYLESYFANKNKSRKKSKKDNKKKYKEKYKTEPVLIKDVINGYYDPSNGEESDNSYATPYGTLLLSGSRTREMEMYHRLNDAGWNSYKIMKNSKCSKRERNLFKPIKKAKKGKKAKKAMRELGVEDTLVQIFEDMGYDDYEDYAKEMLNMTSADVFK